MKRKRFLSFLICMALVIVLLPATSQAAPSATAYPVTVKNGTVFAATAQVYGGVPYVEAGDMVTVTPVIPTGLSAYGYDYSSQAFAYWAAGGVLLADIKTSPAVFVMPGNPVSLTAEFKTAVSVASAKPQNPFRNLSAVLDLSNNRIDVSLTPARDFSVNLMGKHDVSQYEDLASAPVGSARAILRRAVLEYQDGMQAVNDLRSAGGLAYFEGAFVTRDKYLTMPGSGASVLICPENWDRIVDEYFMHAAPDYSLDETDAASLKKMRFLEKTHNTPYLYILMLATLMGDPSATARDWDVASHDFANYYMDLDFAFRNGLPEDLLKRVKLEFGNSFYYEVYYLDDAGNEVILDTYMHTPTPGTMLDHLLFSQIGSAGLNHCQPTYTYRQGAVEQNMHNPSTQLSSIADKIRVRFIIDEVMTNAGNDPFVATYTDVIVPVPSVLGVTGITPDATYASADKIDFSTQIGNLFEGEPGEGGLRLLPVSWQLDNAAPTAISGAFGGTVDMARLSSGGHRLTVNFAYQAYTGGIWVDRGTIVPYGISFKVSAPASSNLPVRTLINSATGITVSGNISINATLTVEDISLHTKGTCAACDTIRKAQKGGRFLFGYDISLSPTTTGPLTISIPMDSKYNGQTITILHCINGRLETINATVVNGVAMFIVTELSPFAVTAGLLVPHEITDIPKTGDAPTPWGFVIGIAALCAGYMVMKRRKKA